MQNFNTNTLSQTNITATYPHQIQIQATMLAQILRNLTALTNGEVDCFPSSDRVCIASLLPNKVKCVVLVSYDEEIDPDNFLLTNEDMEALSNITR